MIRLLSALLVVSACAARSPTAAAPADTRSTARPGDPPPEFAPSGADDRVMPITSNDYGVFVGAPNAPELGDVAPDFEGALIDGGQFRLAEARAAGPVLVMFYRGFW